MALVVPTQHSPENPALTKPTEWAFYMVSASLTFANASDSTTPGTYSTSDAARLDVLNVLNWYEAHSEYTWPEFTSMGFDFGQAMRLRRQLVSDVCVALEKMGKIRVAVGGLRSPESEGGGGKRSLVTARMAERKRQCKRYFEDHSDTEVASNASDKCLWHDEAFLAEGMREMIDRSRADVNSYLNCEKDVGALADIVHDGLVRHWDGPQAEYGSIPDDLQKKKQAWEAEKLTRPEQSLELGEIQSREGGGVASTA
ncbi:hypothetical protein FB567DRAFT_515517 [Paraphoma chrysanthemicola]|uniref:Uncharacterized protein n=1 Tax=Paraphoma chrysanthemicola TaxID=798071 RepID=A0A8K0RIF3_9PLEO|nr:hypothetical protein FB567DRAFT_515517 [Paraphoma chrysanthemicola]